MKGTMKTIDEKYAKQIDEIMANFDFQKVLKVMRALDWKWQLKTVTMKMLRDCALDHLNTVSGEDFYVSTSGGLYAKRDGEYLRLSFEVDSWNGDTEGA